MKLKSTHLAPLVAITLAGPASAANTLLLSDNFNTDNQNNSTFNRDLAADQTGTLKPVNYITSGAEYDYRIQHGNSGNMLLAGQVGGFRDLYAGLDHNFAGDVNSLGKALEIKFTVNVFDTSDGTDWASIAVGSTNNLFVNDAGNQFSSLFRDNGGTQQFKAGTSVGTSATFADGALITLLVSDSAETGSAFTSNGATDVVRMFVNNALVGTWTNLNFGPSDGYISFQTHGANARFDNLSFTAVPEPTGALAGLLVGAGLLRRRRTA